MRRLEFLISDVRRSTDNKDTNGVTDAEIVGYYNDGLRLIQSTIFKVNPKADIFISEITYAVSATGSYDLPEDVFGLNALSLVESVQGTYSTPIDRIDESNRSNLFGYYIRDNKLFVNGCISGSEIRVKYFKALPRFDKRWGKIQTVTPGVSLVLEAGFDALAETIDDKVTVVSSTGAQVRPNVSVAFTGGTLATSDALTGVTAGMFICMGKNSANITTLPDACETFLMDYVRQRIYTRNVYNDAEKQVYFTNKQEGDLASLFSYNTKEVLAPPITDTSFLEF